MCVCVGGGLLNWNPYHVVFIVRYVLERLEERSARRGGACTVRPPQNGSASFPIRIENKFSGMGKVHRSHAYTLQVLALCLV